MLTMGLLLDIGKRWFLEFPGNLPLKRQFLREAVVDSNTNCMHSLPLAITWPMTWQRQWQWEAGEGPVIQSTMSVQKCSASECRSPTSASPLCFVQLWYSKVCVHLYTFHNITKLEKSSIIDGNWINNEERWNNYRDNFPGNSEKSLFSNVQK